MKLSLSTSLVALTSLAINGVNACWQVHAMLASDLFTGDTLEVQAKNNDVQECLGGDTIYLASGDTTWTISCGNLVFTMTDNGKSGHVSGTLLSPLVAVYILSTYLDTDGIFLDPDNGYEADLVMSSTQEDTVECGCTDEGCLHCLQVESCLDDNYSNCDSYPYCALCDYKSYC